MSKTLVIVESPGKIKKIKSILGPEYNVMASVGHIRNLDPTRMSIDIDNDFKPEYIIINDKKQVVYNLKQAVKTCKEVILAADEDREGEAIAASLADVLKLKNPKRIVFNSITKKDILNALRNPTIINQKLVDAQRARMILDKIVGYKLSPLLWKNVGPKLSGGRVQSVVVKIIVDKENAINNFDSNNYFKITGNFEHSLKGSLKKSKQLVKLKDDKLVIKLFETFKKCKYFIDNIKERVSTKNPSPPFITSSLQQEASSKFGFSPKITMMVAQKLYEQGLITYMRTDSTNLSEDCLKQCSQVIIDKFGKEYYIKRVYKSKSKNAQEAHEAIRPTHVENSTCNSSNPQQQKLYSLIWKRTIASQMASSKTKIFTIIISSINNTKKLSYYFESTIEKLFFDGFLKIYNIQIDDSKVVLPEKGSEIKVIEILASEEYTKSGSRFTEASLVKELEKQGIGRPSTFANIISKIQNRKYIEKKNITGKTVDAKNIVLKKNKIKIKKKTINLGNEKNKLVPTVLGTNITNYLVKNFTNIMNYKFSAQLEDGLDLIANGEIEWVNYLKKFYNPFNKIYLKLEAENPVKTSKDKLLGRHPETNFKLYTTTTRYGDAIKIKVSDKKYKFVSINKPYNIETITLDQAIVLCSYPRILGSYKDEDIELCKGRYGLYIKYNKQNYNCSDKKIDLDEAIKIISDKEVKQFKIKNKTYEIKDGKFGPYISYTNKNKKIFRSIPAKINPKSITKEQIIALVTTTKSKK